MEDLFMEETITSKKRIVFLYLAAAFLPVCVFIAGFAVCGVYPFGDRSAMIVDGANQYLGLYEELRAQIKSGAGLFYGKNGLGYDFYSMFAYYLSSPFSLLVLGLRMFLNINEAVTCVILIKIGLSGVCMTWYMRQKAPGRLLMPLCMGWMYALSNYMLGYYSNIMWLDCIMLLPAVTWSIERLTETGRWKPYCILLAYCIFSNYYMGFMLCIYAALCFAGNFILKRPGFRRFFLFAGASLLSAAMNAVLLIPSYLGLRLTHAAQSTGLSAAETLYGNLAEQFSRLFYASYPYSVTSRQDAVNLYCGSMAVFLLVLYLINRNISGKRKMISVGIASVYLLGFHIPALNLLLHGFHAPVGIPNRFAFFFIFLLLCMGAEAWMDLENYTRRQLILALALTFAVCLSEMLYLREANVLLTVLWISLFALCFALTYRGHRRLCRRLFLFLLILELGSHGVLSISHTGTVRRDSYIKNKKEIAKLMSKLPDTEAYRADLFSTTLHNEALLYGLNGVSLFSSTNTEKSRKFMNTLGFATGKNHYLYSGSSEAMDMLLGVKYVVRKNTGGLRLQYPAVACGDRYTVYENPRALKSAYLISGGHSFRLKGGNPLEAQNSLLTGLGARSLYDIREVDTSSMLRLTRTYVSFQISLQKGQHGYLYLGRIGPESVRVSAVSADKGTNLGEAYYSAGVCNTRLIDLGCAETNRSLTVTVGGNAHLAHVLLGTYPESRLNQIYQQLSANQISLTKDTGTVSSNQGGVLVLNRMWQANAGITLDGKSVKILDLGGFPALRVSAGTHTVAVRYRPQGFYAGAAISLAAVGIGILAFYRSSRRKKDISRFPETAEDI